MSAYLLLKWFNDVFMINDDLEFYYVWRNVVSMTKKGGINQYIIHL